MRTAFTYDIQPVAIKLWVIRLFLIQSCFILAPNSTEECHKWLVCSGNLVVTHQPFCWPREALLCKPRSQGFCMNIKWLIIKRFFYESNAVVCYPWDGQENFPQMWCHQGQVTKVSDFSDESGVSVVGSELPLHPPYRGEGIELSGEVSQN